MFLLFCLFVFGQSLVYREFFKQGDLEKAMGNRPVEMMDREKACIPSLQIQFIDDVALPVYTYANLETSRRRRRRR